jgi:hypothetical protein
MAKASLVDLVHDDQTRLGRAVLLFEEPGAEIEDLGEGRFLVPSSTGREFYAVTYGDEEDCSCPDHEFHPNVECKHILMVGISLAKRRTKTFHCDGCHGRYPNAERYEVHEEHQNFSAYFVGERLCSGCARHAGIC